MIGVRIAVRTLCRQGFHCRLILGSPEGCRDVSQRRFFSGGSEWSFRIRRDFHQREQSFDFICLDLNSTLPAAACLVVIDRHGNATDDETPRIGLRQPVVERRPADSQPFCRVIGGESLDTHRNAKAGWSKQISSTGDRNRILADREIETLAAFSSLKIAPESLEAMR